ncbi:MAG: ParB/RepB/Spo0J family partition protein [Nitrosomonas sp.]|nr:ParB/RepB/Spo0J family partition protein [Nitrosomonas sp.]
MSGKKIRQDLPLNALQQLAINSVDEDPNQPRKYFDTTSLNELAESIRLRGVKTPISVRFNEKSGRYTINHGHRRFRASKIARKATIPAYIDNDYLDEDQVIENVQRENLTTRELADYIGRQLAKGKTQAQIGIDLSKSSGWVSLHAKLLNLPDPIAELFHSGKVTDANLIHLLVAAYKADPIETFKWIENNKEEFITRRAVQILRDYIEYNKNRSHDRSDSIVTIEVNADSATYTHETGSMSAPPLKQNSDSISKNTKLKKLSSSDRNEADKVSIATTVLNLTWLHCYNKNKFMSVFSITERKLVKNYLLEIYHEGKKSNSDPEKSILEFLLKSSPIKGIGAYEFMAFLLGKNQKEFNFEEIFKKIYSIRSNIYTK